MHPELNQAFEAEIRKALTLYRSMNMDAAYSRLEKAHVLGQRYLVPHVRCHWLFLKIGWTRKIPYEVWGQLVRLFLGAVGSALGQVPIGNTGGTNIGMFRTLPIDPSLIRLLKKPIPQP